MILIGELSLWIALLMCVWSATLSFAGGRLDRADLISSGERGLYAAFGFVFLAACGLWSALLSSDFSLRYVASFTTANLPVPYKVSAFWGGQSGSLLLWCLILAGYGALASWTNRFRNRGLMPWVTGTNALALLFFVATTAFASNPFERLEWPPAEGRGLDPRLQDPAMAIHPPMLYLGLVATAIPFAFAMAALVSRRLDGEWLGAVRRWALGSWCFLTLGIVLGMWWAYNDVGWGGYWVWDPVENASLLPWLTGTALLHSILIEEERGTFRRWNVTLVVATFLLSILGAFISRAGVNQSVESFVQGAVGRWLVAFGALALVASIGLVSIRLKDFDPKADLESVLSREAALLSNNLVLVGIAASVLWGSLFPILGQAVRGTEITAVGSVYNSVTVPLALLLLTLTGIGPLLAWRRTAVATLKRQVAAPVAGGLLVGAVLFTLGVRRLYPLMTWTLAAFVAGTIVQEFVQGVGERRRTHGESRVVALGRLLARSRRRYGGYIVHAGIVILFSAFSGMAFRKEYEVALTDGQAFRALDPYGREWTFVSDGLSRYSALNRDMRVISLIPSSGGRTFRPLTSEMRQYFDSGGNPTFEPRTEVGILVTSRQDVHVALTGVVGARAELRISFNPLVVWVWQGSMLLAIGGLIVLWPQSQRSQRLQRTPPDAAELLIAQVRAARASACPQCGPRPESDPLFCSNCGRYLSSIVTGPAR